MPIRKNKINLADYPFKRDIENRLFLAQLSVFDVAVLQEILHSSLRIYIEDMGQTLNVKSEKLEETLKKLSVSKLFKIERGALIVDKEMRKYYESQIEKFSSDFEPDLVYLQSILSKVPIHALPLWYAIPRSSDNITASIIEQYLLTPEVYRVYLSEIEFDDPVVTKIIQDLYRSPNFKITSSELIEKYQLSKEQFEEYILLLEYHFICCIRYEKTNDLWQEVITPFQEWLDYISFEMRTKPSAISDIENIEHPLPPKDFAFLLDMQKVLKASKRKSLSDEDIKALIAHSDEYHQHLIAKLIQLEFISQTETTYRATEDGLNWLGAKFPIEQSASLSNHLSNTLRSFSCSSHLYAPRNLRLIEKSLVKILPPHQWVYLEDFMAAFTAPIGDKDGIILKNKGKKWRYVLPTYKEEEKNFIRGVIMERFYELGYVKIGKHQGKACFALTSFGRITLS